MWTGQFIKNHKCLDYIMLIQNINIVSFMIDFFWYLFIYETRSTLLGAPPLFILRFMSILSESLSKLKCLNYFIPKRTETDHRNTDLFISIDSRMRSASVTEFQRNTHTNITKIIIINQCLFF